MRALFDKETHYYKYIHNSYSSGNAGGMYHYWDEYRAGATCAVKQMSNPTIITSVVMQIGAWTNEFHDGYVCNIQLQGSQNNSSWVTIHNWGDRRGCNSWHTLDCSENKTPYYYYRFYAENGGWAYNDALSVASVEYRGYYTTISEVQAGQPFDYKIDVGNVKVIIEEDIYKASKSFYKIKQYYGK